MTVFTFSCFLAKNNNVLWLLVPGSAQGASDATTSGSGSEFIRHQKSFWSISCCLKCLVKFHVQLHLQLISLLLFPFLNWSHTFDCLLRPTPTEPTIGVFSGGLGSAWPLWLGLQEQFLQFPQTQCVLAAVNHSQRYIFFSKLCNSRSSVGSDPPCSCAPVTFGHLCLLLPIDQLSSNEHCVPKTSHKSTRCTEPQILTLAHFSTL